jgi:DNA-binding MarR family transcriptional regulator
MSSFVDLIEFLHLVDVVREHFDAQPVADHLGISPSQASRALRELQQRGSVFLAEPDPVDHDKRVHRYIVARSAQAA